MKESSALATQFVLLLLPPELHIFYKGPIPEPLHGLERNEAEGREQIQETSKQEPPLNIFKSIERDIIF